MTFNRSERHLVGDVCEAHFQLEALRRKWEICKPFGHTQRYDFVIRRPNSGWETVQVKAATLWKLSPGGFFSIHIRRGTGGKKPERYNANDFDLFAAVHYQTNRIWLIPMACTIGNTCNFSLRGADCFLLGEKEPDLSNIGRLTDLYRTATMRSAVRKITIETIHQIQAARHGGDTYAKIAKTYDLAPSHVRRICNGEVAYANKNEA